MNPTNQPEANRKPQLLTRKQLCHELNERGYVISPAYFAQLCLPSRNQGPPVATWWGARPLYDFQAALAWAEGRCKTASTAA